MKPYNEFHKLILKLKLVPKKDSTPQELDCQKEEEIKENKSKKEKLD